jgi:hypothetical protein
MNGGESLPVEVAQEGAAQDLSIEKYETILVQYDVSERKVTCNDRQKIYLPLVSSKGTLQSQGY